MVQIKQMQQVQQTIPATVKSSDMPTELEEEVLLKSYEAMELFNSDIQIARYLTAHFQQKHKNSVWHCVIGRKFASNITHESRFFIYYYIGTKAFLLFKSS